MFREAICYEPLTDERVQCNLCNHFCEIEEGQAGFCRMRVNQGGRLYTHAFGQTVIQHAEEIESQFLYHFLPGSLTYLIATPGCNFRCPSCQRWEIARMPLNEYEAEGRVAAPDEIVTAAVNNGVSSITYGYIEPTVFLEYVLETAQAAKQAGLSNVLVTNGFMSSEALDLIVPFVDAIHLDLKGFHHRSFHNEKEVNLDPILNNAICMKKAGIWLEIGITITPNHLDIQNELRQLAQFIGQELGMEVPLHIHRQQNGFLQKNSLQTSYETLKEAKEIAQGEGLRYIYLDSMPGENHTFCPTCGTVLIRRSGRVVVQQRLLIQDSQETGHCPECGQAIEGHWIQDIFQPRVKSFQIPLPAGL